MKSYDNQEFLCIFNWKISLLDVYYTLLFCSTVILWEAISLAQYNNTYIHPFIRKNVEFLLARRTFGAYNSPGYGWVRDVIVIPCSCLSRLRAVFSILPHRKLATYTRCEINDDTYQDAIQLLHVIPSHQISFLVVLSSLWCLLIFTRVFWL